MIGAYGNQDELECVTLSPHGEAQWYALGNTPSIRLL